MHAQQSAEYRSMSYLSIHESAVYLDELRDLALGLSVAVTDLSKAEKDFLHDLARQRYEMKAVLRLRGIAARSPQPEHHEALSEMVRPRGAVPCFVEATKVETLSTGPTDIAQMAFVVEPTKANAIRLRDRLLGQIGASRWALSGLLGHKVWQ